MLTAGGNDAGRTYMEYDRDKVQRMWDDDVAQSQHESGTSYSGEIGMLTGPIQWNDKKLGTAREAWDFIMETHYKGDPPIAVSFETETEVPRERQDAWRKKHQDAEDAHRRKAKEIVTKAITGGKSTLLPACKGCGSKLSREHIARGVASSWGGEGAACPLCRSSLLSDSVRKRLDSLKSKHEGRKGRETPRGKKTGKYGWAIGGIASS